MTTDNNDVQVNFDTFGFKKDIAKGVREAGFRMPSPIQEQAIPIVMKGSDVIARAQTGTGKTAAFGLPSMNNIKGGRGVEILIIAPTRELASQVSEEMFRLGRYAGVKTVAVYGGQSISRQVEMIQRGANVVTATPGRLLDHLRSKRFRNFAPSVVVLDEADEMLDMGFLEDIEAIFKFLPEERQTLLFSATMPPAIRKLANKILKTPVSIDVTPKEVTTNVDIAQHYYVIEEREREEAMVRLIDTESPGKSIVFCRTKREADNLSTVLVSRGYSARALHGDMEQRQRNETIASFKKGQSDMLVATDVAARGLDITDVTHVFNYHIPFNPESYIHRIGRTGRAGKKGVAITLVTPLEFKELSRIMKVSGAPIKYREVPSIHEVKQNYMDDLFARLKDRDFDDEILDMVQGLSGEMDVTSLACKALSLLLDDQKVAGPNRIGFSSGAVEKMMHRFKSQYGGRKQYGGQKRYGGNKRPGGGGYGKGGYRGRGGSGGRRK
ncbi:MAG: DEAD/DEAH box helicase [Deltaproteobacteria bacterium]|nr:DEAD/DEAH box helicase [Deltaproteobacteria bacterium]